MIVAAGRAAIELWYRDELSREEIVRDTTRGVSALLAACGSDQSQTNILAPLTQSASGILGRTPAAGPTAAQIRSRITPEVRASFGNVPLKIATLEEKNISSVLIERARNRDQITYFTPDGLYNHLRSIGFLL